MDNVQQLRPRQPFMVGDMVCIGTKAATFQVAGLGLCGPIDTSIGPEGKLTNGDEFVQLAVPGMERAVFNIHKNFLRKVDHGNRD